MAKINGKSNLKKTKDKTVKTNAKLNAKTNDKTVKTNGGKTPANKKVDSVIFASSKSKLKDTKTRLQNQNLIQTPNKNSMQTQVRTQTQIQTQMVDRLVPDTSVIIDGILSSRLEKGTIKIRELLLHEAVLAELEHQSNQGRAVGFVGLDELQKLQKLSKNQEFVLSFIGRRPSFAEIKYAKLGEIDSLIRELAYDEDATLMTADKVQAKLARAKSMKLIFIPPQKGEKILKLEKFFDDTTMSVHLRERVPPFAKKGKPGAWKFEQLRRENLSSDEIKDISREIIEEARLRSDAFIEIEREGSTITQLGRYRIVVTKPPFSDGWEITAVRPVKKLTLEEYKLSEKLMTRIANQAEGVLIAGSPGNGKSTFAQALAEYYSNQNKIVKTIEAPRDLVLPERVTQYSVARGTSQEIHDVLLLSRPDYTVFDEMRNTDDFAMYVDLRLAGIGLAGVIHAKRAVDAIQRFVGRVELGVIPQVIDTVIFIENGNVGKVLSLKMMVKVPAGMVEQDLARPVVVVNDFETNKAEFELYTYGEQTVIVPVNSQSVGEQSKGAKRLAANEIKRALQKFSEYVKVDVVGEHKAVVYVPEKYKARIIGREGKTINKIEKELGMGIDIRTLEDDDKKELRNLEREGELVGFETSVSKKFVDIYLDPNYSNTDIDIYIDGEVLVTLNVGKNGKARVKKTNNIGKALMDALKRGSKITIRA